MCLFRYKVSETMECLDLLHFPFWLLSDTGFLAPLLGAGAGTAAQALPSSTWFQHALCQRLPVEGVRGGVQQVPQDDGAVHDGAGGQSHGVSHQGVH